LFDKQAHWLAVAHFDECYSTFANVIEMLEKLDDVRSQNEVILLQFLPRIISGPEPNVLNNERCRGEDRFTAVDLEVFDPTKGISLHQPKQ
jgi:hypothetical protein